MEERLYFCPHCGPAAHLTVRIMSYSLFTANVLGEPVEEINTDGIRPERRVSCVDCGREVAPVTFQRRRVSVPARSGRGREDVLLLFRAPDLSDPDGSNVPLEVMEFDEVRKTLKRLPASLTAAGRVYAVVRGETVGLQGEC